MCIGVSICSFGKISIKRMHNGIFFSFVCSGSVPLPDTRPTGIRKHLGSHFFKIGNNTISFDSITNLLRTRIDSKFRLRSYSVCHRLSDNRSRTRHIFVRRISTRTYQTPLYFYRPTVSFGFGLHLRNRSTSVRSKRPVNMRF